MKMWNELFELKGEKVKLLPISLHHIEGLWEAAKPDEIWTYMATTVRNKEEMKQMIASAIQKREKGTEYTFTVVNQEDKIIGSTRYLDISPEQKSLEIGSTWYHPDSWRTSINTECKYLLLQHVFESWKVRRVQLKTDSRNLRSQKAIERIGAVKEGTLRKDRKIAGGYVRDTVYYSILDDEWGTVKLNLERKLGVK
ncbi:GNAT family N-acetyltransferase [Bacillus sp. EB106-08-02-XG196]|uniref:GNAT family N-acetyltransferase n=1 Tax=Bacillus sp. EB106-08-02-XG196 TaxID=2737049 RepID=UPI0015C4E40B|nr:GNAT family protein [Bacillus sp. EB106-08-02-XG196]NWQ42097.1 GNAT family N-acetyltransferase [Bacillus sp. EB106-08-02-XG196]